MAFVGSLLVFLLFGIVVFGYLMAFRQNLTQAAAEGARAGAVAASSSAVTTDAQSAAEQSISGFHACNNGLTCTAVKGACPSAPLVTCVTVTLVYDYEHYPLLPDVPIIGAFLPETISTSAVAEVNFP